VILAKHEDGHELRGSIIKYHGHSLGLQDGYSISGYHDPPLIGKIKKIFIKTHFIIGKVDQCRSLTGEVVEMRNESLGHDIKGGQLWGGQRGEPHKGLSLKGFLKQVDLEGLVIYELMWIHDESWKVLVGIWRSLVPLIFWCFETRWEVDGGKLAVVRYRLSFRGCNWLWYDLPDIAFKLFLDHVIWGWCASWGHDGGCQIWDPIRILRRGRVWHSRCRWVGTRLHKKFEILGV